MLSEEKKSVEREEFPLQKLHYVLDARDTQIYQ